MEIGHVVVLMLENRSFDSMLGQLHSASAAFSGLVGDEVNIWHRGTEQQPIQVWTDPSLGPANLTIPDPNPGELFTDIQMQLHGLNADGSLKAGLPDMSGFVDSYMRQTATNPAPDPYSVMHYFSPNHVPVISQLARSFGVSDTWHASAPCQTWANRFFTHCGTAGGYLNNSPTHFPYLMETVFNRLSGTGASWRIYFHDIPQASTLSRIWADAITHFEPFERFESDAAGGALPNYSFIEPRYFPNALLGTVPNDEHPPHNLSYGEQLIAAVYNAVRSGPGWPNTLLIITYDEHGGCYDHVSPPPAIPPGGPYPDGYTFDSFGVRVPTVIVSPYIAPGKIIRPNGPTPFDHTSIIATLRDLYRFQPLTARDAAAPSLLPALQQQPTNNGPPSMQAPAAAPAAPLVARAAARPLNGMQASLATAAIHLPTAGADLDLHSQRLTSVPDTPSMHTTAGSAGAAVASHMKAFLAK